MLSSAISYASSTDKNKKKGMEDRGRRGGWGVWERKRVRVAMGESIRGESMDCGGTSSGCMGTKKKRGDIRWGENRCGCAALPAAAL